MSSSENVSPTNVKTQNTNTVSFVPPELLLSLTTAPALLALVGGKVLTEAIRELGLFSEEIFRGDRLPVLHVPSETERHPDDRTSL